MGQVGLLKTLNVGFSMIKTSFKVCPLIVALLFLSLGVTAAPSYGENSEQAHAPAECCSGNVCNDCCGEAKHRQCNDENPVPAILSSYDAGYLIRSGARPFPPGITKHLSLPETVFPTSLFPIRPPARSPPLPTISV